MTSVVVKRPVGICRGCSRALSIHRHRLPPMKIVVAFPKPHRSCQSCQGSAHNQFREDCRRYSHFPSPPWISVSLTAFPPNRPPSLSSMSPGCPSRLPSPPI